MSVAALTIAISGFTTNPDSESIEDYLISKGHNLTNCEWMVHKSSTIYTLTKEDDVVNTN